MTDQMIPASLTREEARDVREWAESALAVWAQDQPVAKAARVVLAALPAPTRPTLAGMTDEERAACQWMQADTKLWGRVVIIVPDLSDGRTALLDQSGDVIYGRYVNVTPRPDLPRMEWPGDQKAALEETPESEEEFMANIEKSLDDHYGPLPAPALPDGWRLADHEDHGRVIVTNPTPDPSGHVYFVIPADDPMGYDWLFCGPARLTYLEQGDDTSDAVPESTLAVGSEWHDADALTRACEEVGRDQIAVTDRDGNVSVWDARRDDWRGHYRAIPKSAPYTIINAGKKADQ